LNIGGPCSLNILIYLSLFLLQHYVLTFKNIHTQKWIIKIWDKKLACIEALILWCYKYMHHFVCTWSMHTVHNLEHWFLNHLIPMEPPLTLSISYCAITYLICRQCLMYNDCW
jgi:hypothetical protein